MTWACYYTVWGGMMCELSNLPLSMILADVTPLPEQNPVRADQSSYNGLFFEAVRSKRQGPSLVCFIRIMPSALTPYPTISQIALQRYVRRHPPLECRVDGGSEGLTVDVP